MFNAINCDGKKVHIDNSNNNEQYFCPLCNSKLIRKMGRINIHHFSHLKGYECDSWYNPMSEWHKKWQSIFPIEKQEVVLTDGIQKHISDVCLNEVVLEFQHSPISTDDLIARNLFYQNAKGRLIWIIDCLDKEIYILLYTRCLRNITCIEDGILDFYWRYRKRVFDVLELSSNLAIYFHIKDNILINVTEKLYWNGFQKFRGRLVTIEDFLNSLALYDDLNIYTSKDVFKDFIKRHLIRE